MTTPVLDRCRWIAANYIVTWSKYRMRHFIDVVIPLCETVITPNDIDPHAKVVLPIVYRGVEAGTDSRRAIRAFKGGDLGDGVYVTEHEWLAKTYGGGPNGARIVHAYRVAPLFPEDVAYLFGGAQAHSPVSLVTGNGIEIWQGAWSGKTIEAALHGHDIKIVIGTPQSVGVNQIAVREPALLSPIETLGESASHQDTYYHGTSIEVARYLEVNGFGTGTRQGGMASHPSEIRRFTFLTPSLAVARWYALNHFGRADGAVVKVHYAANALTVAGSVNVYGALADAGERLGVAEQPPPDRLDVTAIVEALRQHDLNAVAYHDRDSGNRSALLALDPASVRFVKATVLSPRKLREAAPSPEFARWFGDSKVVNAAGDPLVVYHGTHADFTAFDLGQSPEGFYFTDDRMRAELYAEDGGRMIAAYLSIQRPAPFKEYAALAGRGWNRAMQEMMRRGYDGVIWHDNNTTYVAFHPEQIKPVDEALTLSEGAEEAVASAIMRELSSAGWSTPAECNDGYCGHFADNVVRELGRGRVLSTDTIKIGPHPGGRHEWIFVNGRHYDSETPYGVDDPRDLGYFCRHDGRPMPPSPWEPDYDQDNDE